MADPLPADAAACLSPGVPPWQTRRHAIPRWAMPDTFDKFAFDKFAFETAQAARIGWFFGQKLLAARLSRPVPAPPELAGREMPDRRRLLADLWRLVEADWRSVASGLYAAPEAWRGGPLEALRRALDFFADPRAVEQRRHGGAAAALLDAAEAPHYPASYRRKFLFQSDGYLSEASAESYDHQVEVLFGGGAAAMRRQALVPLRQALVAAAGRRPGDRPRLLDLACGTGSFLREVKTNWPRLDVTGLDLSAYYLEVAQRNLRPWSRVRLVEGAAETMPFAEGEFDVVTAIYLFHELPPRVRRSVVREIGRVLRPHGTLILVDSLQTGDDPDYDAMLDSFPALLHEPFYASYLREDLDRLLGPGFTPAGRVRAYFSKVLSYRRAPD